MKRSLLAASVLIGMMVQVGTAQDAAISKPKPEISLTLIPPSPVTDKITLEIRGAVWNRTGETRKFDVAVYSDAEKLHQETVEIAPQSAAGIKFHWPTKGQAGDHKIILVAKSGDEIRKTVKPLKIIASKIRSTETIAGAWVGIYHWSEKEGRPWNADIKKMTDDDWRNLVRGMHGIGMDIINIQELFRNQVYDRRIIEQGGYKGLAFYPSKLFPGRMPIAAKDPVEAILDEADKLGMNVFMGVGLYAWFDYSPGSLAWHKKVAKELWDMYGHHPSFYGWNLSEEGGGALANAKDLIAFCRGFTGYVRTLAPDKPVLMARNTYALRGAEDIYRQVLPNVDILCSFCFHRMRARDRMTGEEAASLLQSLCDETGSHLWMDMEVFLFDKGGALVPRPISGLLSDLKRFPNFEKILCYQYPGLLTAPDASIKLGGDPAVKLYQDYKKYLEGTLSEIVSHAAVGKPVAYAAQCAPQYSGGGPGSLTDGLQATDNYRDGLWKGYAGVGLDATIDLGKPTDVSRLSAAFLRNIQGGIYLPPTVEYAVSDDGKEFRVVATVKPVCPNNDAIAIGKAEASLTNVRGRYVRLRAANAGTIPAGQPGAGTPAWLFVDEIMVNPEKKTGISK